MQEFESMLTDVEQVAESSQETKEWVGGTEICNFEGCQLTNNEQLAGYLSENLPPSHLEGCPAIEFDPNNSLFQESPNTLGFYETGSHAIHICDESRFANGSAGLLDTVIHEVGHNTYAGFVEINPELDAKWQQLHQNSLEKYNAEGTGFVSDYATTNKFEDFAESYKSYVRDPEKLQFLCPEKYEFLHDYVFSGREYQPSILAYLVPIYNSAGSIVGYQE